MFQAKKKVDLNQTDTLIGQGTTMDGSLRSEASIRIEGEIKGDIECGGDCIIGEKGYAESNIRARNISVAGKVSGDVTAKEKLTILSTGALLGDAHASALIVEEGGLFNGKSNMNDKSEAASANEKDVKQLEKAKAAT